jgi:hypothetical protein
LIYFGFKNEAIKTYSLIKYLRRKKALETTVATLLLVTSTIVLACVVVNYAVSVVEQTLNTENIPELDRIRSIQDNILNQTDRLYNSTLPSLPTDPPP